jgi:transcription elongation factor GreA
LDKLAEEIMEKVHMTPEGLKILEEELKKLKFVERPAVVAAIAAARALGDLSENAEYHSAKDKQGFIEGRIRELESKLSRAEVIDIKKLEGTSVKFGATVTIFDETADEEIAYRIVGVDEADIKKKLLSVEAPLARALIGKVVGDETELETPSGKKKYEVVKIEYI